MSPSPAVPPASARATRRLCGWDVVRLSSLQASPLGVGTPEWERAWNPRVVLAWGPLPRYLQGGCGGHGRAHGGLAGW